VNAKTGAVIQVDCFDMATGKVIAGATLTVTTRQNGAADYEEVARGTTDETGSVRLEKIPEGVHHLILTAPGYAPRSIAHEKFSQGAVRTFLVELAREATLAGRVVDEQNRPVTGIKVRPNSPLGLDGRGYPAPERTEVVTDDEGRFELKGLPTGYVLVWVSAREYFHNHLEPLYNVPSTNVVIQVVRTGNLRVRVVDSEGNPMPNFQGNEVHVHVEPESGPRIGAWSGSARVNADGAYDFIGLPPGKYRATSRPNPATDGKKYAEEAIIEITGGKSETVTLVYK
jgi:hypothetical protein